MPGRWSGAMPMGHGGASRQEPLFLPTWYVAVMVAYVAVRYVSMSLHVRACRRVRRSASRVATHPRVELTALRFEQHVEYVQV